MTEVCCEENTCGWTGFHPVYADISLLPLNHNRQNVQQLCAGIETLHDMYNKYVSFEQRREVEYQFENNKKKQQHANADQFAVV